MIVRWGLDELGDLLLELDIMRPLLVSTERWAHLELPVRSRFLGVEAHVPVATVEAAARAVAGSDELFVFGGFQAKNREFIDAVKSGGQPSSHFGDALKTMEVADKILAQSLLRGE